MTTDTRFLTFWRILDAARAAQGLPPLTVAEAASEWRLTAAAIDVEWRARCARAR